MELIHTEKLKIKEKTFTAVRIELAKAPLLMIVSDQKPNAYVACGYVSITAADKFGDVAAFVSGVKTVPELLAAKIKNVSQNAEEAGAKTGMTGKTFLEAFG